MQNLKKIAIVLVVLFVAACGKDENKPPANEFTVPGTPVQVKRGIVKPGAKLTVEEYRRHLEIPLSILNSAK